MYISIDKSESTIHFNGEKTRERETLFNLQLSVRRKRSINKSK